LKFEEIKYEVAHSKEFSGLENKITAILKMLCDCDVLVEIFIKNLKETLN
jgi:hypothetical protein